MSAPVWVWVVRVVAFVVMVKLLLWAVEAGDAARKGRK